ncbi:hypothetical protein FACS189493_2530 [Spirochaetia bacterium]|nr:hypothetical protein FACS189493_2530 [Spirochaetia bacterium]
MFKQVKRGAGLAAVCALVGAMLVLAGCGGGKVSAIAVKDTVKNTHWEGTSSVYTEDDAVSIDFGNGTFKMVEGGDSTEGTYTLLTAVVINSEGYKETVPLVGTTLDLYGVLFTKTSGKAEIKNTKWEATVEGMGSAGMEFSDTTVKMTGNGETALNGTYSTFTIIRLAKADGGSEDLKLDATGISDEWETYTLTKGTASSSSSSSSAAASSTSSSTDWTKLLNDYEKFVNDYIDLMKKAAEGDLTALTKTVSLLEQATSLSDQLQAAGSDLSTAQTSKLLEIQKKLADAASSLY